MSEESPTGSRARTFTDGNWSAHYLIEHGRLALVVEQSTSEGRSIVSFPLTRARARGLRGVIDEMLTEAGEPVHDPPIGTASDDDEVTRIATARHRPTVSLRTGPRRRG